MPPWLPCDAGIRRTAPGAALIAARRGRRGRTWRGVTGWSGTGIRRSRLPALAAGGTRAGAPARRARTRARRGRPGGQSCAGQGRDVIGALTGHPRRGDVRARLVELDERNVAFARQAAQAAGLHRVEVLQADAGVTDACAGAVPAQVVLACGIFGNISERHPGHGGRPAQPVRTRRAGRVDQAPPPARPDPAIRSWFAEAASARRRSTSAGRLHVGGGAPADGRARRAGLGQRLFTFPGGAQPGPVRVNCRLERSGRRCPRPASAAT